MLPVRILLMNIHSLQRALAPAGEDLNPKGVSMRFKVLFPSLAAALAVAFPAGAVLKHYRLEWTTIADFNTANPQVNNYGPGNTGPSETLSKVVIEDHSSNPVLKKLVLQQEN